MTWHCLPDCVNSQAAATADHKGALPPCVSPGIFRFAAKAGGVKMQTAVTEDRALLGSNLSAGDGPKLAGWLSGCPSGDPFPLRCRSG